MKEMMRNTFVLTADEIREALVTYVQENAQDLAYDSLDYENANVTIDNAHTDEMTATVVVDGEI